MVALNFGYLLNRDIMEHNNIKKIPTLLVVKNNPLP